MRTIRRRACSSRTRDASGLTMSVARSGSDGVVTPQMIGPRAGRRSASLEPPVLTSRDAAGASPHGLGEDHDQRGPRSGCGSGGPESRAGGGDRDRHASTRNSSKCTGWFAATSAPPRTRAPASRTSNPSPTDGPTTAAATEAPCPLQHPPERPLVGVAVAQASAPRRRPPRGDDPRTRTRRPRPAAATAPRAWTGRRTAPRPRACRRSPRRSRSPRRGRGTPARAPRDRSPRARRGRGGPRSASGRRSGPPWRRSPPRPRPGSRRTTAARAHARGHRQPSGAPASRHRPAGRSSGPASGSPPCARSRTRSPGSSDRASRHETGIAVTAAAGSQTVTLMIRFCFPPTTVSPAKITTGFVLVDGLDGRDRARPLLAQLEVAGRRGRRGRLVRRLPRGAPLERRDDQPVPGHRHQGPDRPQRLPDLFPHLVFVHRNPSLLRRTDATAGLCHLCRHGLYARHEVGRARS